MSKTFAISKGGTAQTTSAQVIVATAAQTAFTFVGVPASYNDYLVFRNNGKLYSITDYTTSGNVITTVQPCDNLDLIGFNRIK